MSRMSFAAPDWTARDYDDLKAAERWISSPAKLTARTFGRMDRDTLWCRLSISVFSLDTFVAFTKTHGPYGPFHRYFVDTTGEERECATFAEAAEQGIRAFLRSGYGPHRLS